MDQITGGNLLTGLELATRNCYKSEDKICAGSAKKLLRETIFPRKHFSVLEHGHIILSLSRELYEQFMCIDVAQLDSDNYMREDGYDQEWSVGKTFFSYTDLYEHYVLSGNIRSFNRLYKECPEKEVVRILQSFLATAYPVLFSIKPKDTRIFSPKDIIELRPEQLSPEEKPLHWYETVRFIVDKGVSHELVRHRFRVSYSQESSRYVNYGSGVTVIDPRPAYQYDATMQALTAAQKEMIFDAWLAATNAAEKGYLAQLAYGAPPQIARGALPTSAKTDIVATTNLFGWKDIFRQRAKRNAHPQMQEVMIDLASAFRTDFSFYI
jgi:thymidylate synthase (FAD)